MNKDIKKSLKLLLSACVVLSALFPQTAAAKDFLGFTNDRPLVVVSDYDFRPFEFLGSDGKPAGYNVEVLDLILTRLEIPHKFDMREWNEATRLFEHRDADLIHAMDFHYKSRPYVMTKKYLNYYNLRTVRRFDTPPLKRIANLDHGDTIMVKKNDFAAMCLEEMKDRKFTIGYCAAKDGVTGVRKGQYKYYIWGEVPLSNKIQELGLDSLILEEIDIPAGELHIVGYDKYIIDLIDDQYTRLEEAGELQRIYDKWFHPERVHDDASPVSLLLIVCLVAVASMVALLVFLTRRRAKNTVRNIADTNNMMSQALNMGDYYVIEWDLKTGMLQNKYGKLIPEKGMPTSEFLSHMEPGESEHLHQMNMQLIKAETDNFEIEIKYNHGTAEKPHWREYYGQGIAEREGGKTQYIVYAIKDITRQREDERHNRTLGSKYMKIFETNLMALSIYDAEGRLLAINRKMLELCEIGENNKDLTECRLFDFPTLKEVFPPGSRETLHVCQHLYEPLRGINKYIEHRTQPVFDDDGRLVYYIVANRDITAERNITMKQREHDRRLQETKNSINYYEEQLRYLLEECNMYVWRFNTQDHSIHFSRSLRDSMFSLSLQEYMDSLTEDYRQEAKTVLQKAVLQGKPFSAIHRFEHRPPNVTLTWFSISGIPLKDAEGHINEYFGIVRDIDSLMEIQQRLREETARAEDSGKLKSAFLANMTHEIRTPLNAIVGFSGLLQMVDAPEERHEFLRIIRNNCDMLLRLINDILEASSMGQSMAIEPEPVDLPRVFDDICQTLAQRVEEAGLPFEKDNPYDSCPAVQDKGRLQQVLTNFVTNAVKYTKEGHIRVGYRREERIRDGKPCAGLYFYCEDTGSGIPKEKQAAVFERFVKLNDFVQGTGLGLSICKAIIDRSGGEIGVTGDVGIGSTFWFWVPLTVTV